MGGWPNFVFRVQGPPGGMGVVRVTASAAAGLLPRFFDGLGFSFSRAGFFDEHGVKDTRTAQFTLVERLASRRGKPRCGRGRAEAGQGVGSWQPLA